MGGRHGRRSRLKENPRPVLYKTIVVPKARVSGRFRQSYITRVIRINRGYLQWHGFDFKETVGAVLDQRQPTKKI